MAPQEAREGGSDRNSDEAAAGANPTEPSAAGGGSGEFQLRGIPPKEEVSGAGEVVDDDDDATSAFRSPVATPPSLTTAGPIRDQDSDSSSTPSPGSDPESSLCAAASSNNNNNADAEDDDEGYHTPTSPRHRIPPALECPPAPGRKRSYSPPVRSSPSGRRRRVVLDLDTRLLVAQWWAAKLLRQMKTEEDAKAKRPRIRDL